VHVWFVMYRMGWVRLGGQEQEHVAWTMMPKYYTVP
jgi:hypothetical protein